MPWQRDSQKLTMWLKKESFSAQAGLVTCFGQWILTNVKLIGLKDIFSVKPCCSWNSDASCEQDMASLQHSKRHVGLLLQGCSRQWAHRLEAESLVSDSWMSECSQLRSAEPADSQNFPAEPVQVAHWQNHDLSGYCFKPPSLERSWQKLIDIYMRQEKARVNWWEKGILLGIIWCWFKISQFQ